MIIGHHDVVAALQAHLPDVTLLRGPRSVGKWTLAEHLADHHGVAAIDRLVRPDGLTTVDARAIVSFTSTAGFGPFRLVMAALDGSTTAALNGLLKTLEEPPPSTRFILTAAASPPATLMSRCSTYRLGLLPSRDLHAILISLGMSERAATNAVSLGHRQVDVALRATTNDDAHALVLTLVRAIATSDLELFHRAFKTWDSATHELLVTWLREAVTGQWARFTAQDAFGLSPRLIRAMLVAVSEHPAARTRIGVRAALEPFVTRP